MKRSTRYQQIKKIAAKNLAEQDPQRFFRLELDKIYSDLKEVALNSSETRKKLSALIYWLEKSGFQKEAVELSRLTKTAVLKKLKRTTRGKGKKDRIEWALVSKSNPKKILKWFGPDKPSKKEVAKEERRVHAFG